MHDITMEELTNIITDVLDITRDDIKRARLKMLPLSETNAILEVEVHFAQENVEDYRRVIMSALIENDDFSNVKKHFEISVQEVNEGV